MGAGAEVGAGAGAAAGTKPAPPLVADPGGVAVRERDGGRFAQEIAAGHHHFAADEPADYGGDDSGPTPYDLLPAGLGACTTMTVRMYAERKGWPLDRAEVRLSHEKIHARDCADCETREGRIDRIDRRLKLEGPLDARSAKNSWKSPINARFTGP